MAKSNTNQENNEKNEQNENIEELKKALVEEKSRCEENLARWQRAQADFINFKRFAEQEKSDICKFANAGLVLNLLPVLDDFERALAAIPAEESQKPWVAGIELIYRKIGDTLEKQGVSRIKAVDQEFDPRFMEALACTGGKRDIVIQELEKGYKLNDKVIRPAKVIVGIGEETKKEE